MTLVSAVQLAKTHRVCDVDVPALRSVSFAIRAVILNGGAGTEFGERQASSRIEFRARLYF